MLPKVTLALVLLALLLSLSACASTKPSVVYKPVEVERKLPPDLLTCPEIPEAPKPTDSEVAGYILDLWSVAHECKDKLDAIRDLEK